MANRHTEFVEEHLSAPSYKVATTYYPEVTHDGTGAKVVKTKMVTSEQRDYTNLPTHPGEDISYH